MGALLSAVLLVVVGASGMVTCHGFQGMNPCHGLQVKTTCHGPPLQYASPQASHQCCKSGHVCLCSWQGTCLPYLSLAINIWQVAPYCFSFANTSPTPFAAAIYHPPELPSRRLI